MLRDRSFLFIVLVILVLVAGFLLWRRSGRGLFNQQQPETTAPAGLSSVIPADWVTLPDQQYQCDFDGDGELEWLITYSYDQTQVQQPYQKTGTMATRSAIGAAIFDTQNNPIPADSGNPSPYQPTLVIPYRLLPDLYEGKGQGYLGETSVVYTFNPPLNQGQTRRRNDAEPVCQVNEITVLGYSDANTDLPTRLSIFRWQDVDTGYIDAAFIGDEQVAADVPLDGQSTVTAVTTYNRLHNHRSRLCEVSTYNRDTTQPLAFTQDTTIYTIDFCFGSPPDPAFPEGVVVSYLRGNTPAPRSPSAPTVPTGTYLLTGVNVPPSIQPGPTARIFALTNPATVGSNTSGGHICTSQEIDVPPVTEATPVPGQGWICGRASATIETEVVFPDMVRRVSWKLISLNPEQVNGDVHWRISEIEVVNTP